ncbi:MAG: DUF1501 domain-containing protein, partial [Armatimonadetes bacterium]|nr:DUF1501 domain-containing protein [Armatimonadota bacterium]
MSSCTWTEWEYPMERGQIQFQPQHRERLLRHLSRRELFSRLGLGAGALALASLLAEPARGEFGESAPHTLALREPHHPPRVKRVIYLFQNGGPSHVDLFDPKPELKRQDGQKPGAGFVNDVDAKKTGAWLGSPFRFARHGQSGLELSELLPGLARHADDIAVIRSMVSEHENHEQACGHMHTGSPVAGRPTM